MRMVLKHQADSEAQSVAICSVIGKLGPTAETVRTWVSQAEVDGVPVLSDHRGVGGDQPAEAGENRVAPGERDLQVGVGLLCVLAQPPKNGDRRVNRSAP